MKKLFSISLLGILLIVMSTSGMFARYHRDSSPNNFLTFSFFLKPVSFGYKLRLFNNFYATGNMDYQKSTSDLEFQAGAVYLFPVKIIIFRFYAGGGYQLSRNEGYQYPYVMVGTNFIFLFSEVIYPMETRMDPKYRFGLSIKF